MKALNGKCAVSHNAPGHLRMRADDALVQSFGHFVLHDVMLHDADEELIL